MPLPNIYIYERKGKEPIEFMLKDAIKYFGKCPSTIQKWAKQGKLKTRKVNHYPVKKKHSVVNLGSIEQPQDNPLDVIRRCLDKYGNTNLIKEELKYLPQLQKEYELNVKHYKPMKTMSVCLKGDDYTTIEDWIIEDKNWCKKK